MRRKMKRRMGWIVLIGILVSAIAFFAIALTSARTELAKIRAGLVTVGPALEIAAEDEEIKCYLENAVLFYNEGQKRDCFKLLDVAFEKMKDRNRRNFMTLTEEMIRNPAVTSRLGLGTMRNVKATQRTARRFGGG